MTRVIADTHMHVYPCYDLSRLATHLLENLARLEPGAVRAAFLAERSDCHLFDALRDGRLAIPGELLSTRESAQPEALILTEEGKPAAYLYAGRQIVTAERIEILALTVDISLPDGGSAVEVVESVLQAGGIPVLAWAPGKWFFRRKKVVAQLIDRFGPGRLLLGDTTLRPTIWPEPVLMRRASRKGLSVIAGSDPLPFEGEECYAGTYASAIDCAFDSNRPVQSIRAALTDGGLLVAPRGKRCGLPSTLRRLTANARARA